MGTTVPEKPERQVAEAATEVPAAVALSVDVERSCPHPT